MNDLIQFRTDLKAWIDATGTTQALLAKLSGVDQASLSRFLHPPKKKKGNEKKKETEPKGLSLENYFRLRPFVYGDTEQNNV